VSTSPLRVTLILLAVSIGAAGASAQSGGGYDLSWNTIDGGGATFSTGGVFSLGATAGQPDAGNHSAAPFALSGGFWFAPDAIFSVAKDFSDNSTAGVTVSLACMSGVVSPPTATATEATPASFTVTGYTGAPTCTATETVPPGYTANQTGCAGVALSTGTCTITNTAIPGTISIIQTTVPSPDPTATLFSFTAGGGLVPTSFTLANGGIQTFTGVTPGSGYSVAQTVSPGWTLTSATCSDGSLPGNIDLDRNEAITCTFVTSRDPEIPVLSGYGLLLLAFGLAAAATIFLRVRQGL
jgi:hypothetical protein